MLIINKTTHAIFVEEEFQKKGRCKLHSVDAGKSIRSFSSPFRVYSNKGTSIIEVYLNSKGEEKKKITNFGKIATIELDKFYNGELQFAVIDKKDKKTWAK